MGEKDLYKVLTGPVGELQKQLNAAAAEGYRVVGGTLQKEPHGGPATVIVELDQVALKNQILEREGRVITGEHPALSLVSRETPQIIHDHPVGSVSPEAVADQAPTVVSPSAPDVPPVDPSVVQALTQKDRDSGMVGVGAGMVVGQPPGK